MISTVIDISQLTDAGRPPETKIRKIITPLIKNEDIVDIILDPRWP